MAEKNKSKHEDSIMQLRQRIFERVLKTTALIGFPVLIASVLKLAESGYWSFMPVYILFYLLIVLNVVLKNKISFSFRVFFMLLVSVLVSIALLFRFGLSGAGGWFFISLSVFATALMGMRWGLAVTACGCISFIVAGFCIIEGIIPFDFDVVTNNASALSWTIAVGLFCAIGAVVILPQGILQNNLMDFLRILQNRSDELEESNQLLKSEIDSRKKAEEKADSLQKQLIQSQKMEAIGRLAGGIAHDFNNLLTGIMGHISIAKLDLLKEDPLYEIFNELEVAGERAANLTRQLLAFSRKQISKPTIMDLNFNIKSMENMLKRIVTENIDFEMELCSEDAVMLADESQIEQVIVNLVVNARDAMLNGGKLLIKTELVKFDEEKQFTYGTLSAGKYVSLIVKDSGIGISEGLMQKICEPFFTTKEVGKGTGLGLSTVYGIVGQHGGTLNIDSQENKGSTFTVMIPQSDMEKPEISSAKNKLAIPCGNETILIVEDEDIVRVMNTKILNKLGYNVLTAADGESAIKLFNEHKDDISLLLTDVIMPGINGKQLADNIAAEKPEIRIIFTSGYTRDVIGQHGVLEENINFISKPYDTHDLAHIIRNVLDSKKCT